MHYIVVSFSHKNTDLVTREKLAFHNDLEKQLFLENILKSEYINEAILLSTCNRVEIIANVKNTKLAANSIFYVLSNKSEIEVNQLIKLADIFEDKKAVYHIFSVASSLDSVVVGETQIAGQFKEAFKFSMNNSFCAQKLSRVVHFAFKCAAQVRNITSIGEGNVSISSVAVNKAREIFPDGTKALVIGAGKMSELAIKNLLKYNFEVILISRNIKKAKLLASTLDKEIEIADYSNLKTLINSLELLFSATSAPYPIITKDIVEPFYKKRFWFDIAVPRDIDDGIEEVTIFRVDDLKEIVKNNKNNRDTKVQKAHFIVAKMTEEFFNWLNTLEVEPTIKMLHNIAGEIIDQKLTKAIKKGFINKESQDIENIKKLCQNIMNEFLHKPSKNLRKLSNNVESDVVVGSIQNVFDLKVKNTMINKYKCEHSLETSV